MRAPQGAGAAGSFRNEPSQLGAVRGAKAKEFGDQLRSSLGRGQVVIADLTTTCVLVT
jgi:hypothetical protein